MKKTNKQHEYGLCFDKHSKDLYKQSDNFTNNGQCSRCGGCCTHHLPILEKERTAIKKYINENHIEAVYHYGEDPSKGNIDFLCPFLDHTILGCKCNIYPVRPAICKAYKCDLNNYQINTNLLNALQEKNIDPQETLKTHEEIHVGYYFFPKDFAIKEGMTVIINQLHMIEFYHYQGHEFRVLKNTRISNKHKERKLVCIDDPKIGTIWFDEAGLTEIRTIKNKEASNV